MELFAIGLRVILIGVLLISGIAKLFDREGSKEAMGGFGVPERLLPVGSLALPWIEIALALGLVFSSTLPWAASLVAIMFLVFALAMARVARSGEQMECHCFGQLSSSPVSWKTVGRNAILTIFALVVWLYATSIASTNLWSAVSSSVLLATIGIGINATLGYLVWQIRQLDAKLDALTSLPPKANTTMQTNEPAKERSFARLFAGVKVSDNAGEQVPLSRLHTRRKPTLLVFVTNTCPACRALLPDIPKWQEEYTQILQIVVIRLVAPSEKAAKTEDMELNTMYLSDWATMTAILPLRGVPTALLIDRDGFIRQENGDGIPGIRKLIETLSPASGAETQESLIAE